MPADTTFSTSASSLQSVKAIAFAPTPVGGNLQAWNPTLSPPAFDTINSGNWSQHLLNVAELGSGLPGAMSTYVLDVLQLSPPLPARVLINMKFFIGSVTWSGLLADFPTVLWTGNVIAPTTGIMASVA